MTTISLLCPTRARPQNVWRLMSSAMETSTGDHDIEFVFYVDDDDPSYDSIDYWRDIDNRVVVVRGPRIVLSEMWNRAFEASTGEILMHCGDDIIFRTEGWDQIVVDAFERYDDRIVLVHGDDAGGPRGLVFGTHSFIHRRWVEAVGYFCPPYFSSDYNDEWLNTVADLIDRHVFVPIVTEHMHPAFGKAEWDVTHNERIERHFRDKVEDIFYSDWADAERRAQAAMLQAFIEAVKS